MARLWRFRHDWRVAGTADAVYAVCADVDAYPEWWREVRSVERLDDDCGVVLVRSLLPWTLRLEMTREVEDPVGRWLRVRLGGDLTGWAEFTITEVGGGRASAVAYRQEVEVTAPRLRHVAPLLGPVLRANHSVMMRSCERGMARRLGRPLG